MPLLLNLNCPKLQSCFLDLAVDLSLIIYLGGAHSWIMEEIIFWVASHHHQPPLTSKTSKGPNTKPSIRDNDGRPYCTLHWTFIFGLELAIQYAYYCWANLFKLLPDYLMIVIDCLEISWNQCLNCTLRVLESSS